MADNSNKIPINSNIKAEPGSYKRLPSFRTPRDLKLSEYQKIASNPAEAKKKVYVPNFNIQRKKQTEDAAIRDIHKETKTNDKSTPPEKGKKEKGKKKQPNLIQSSGVFSEGLAPSMKTNRWNRLSDSMTSPILERPKLKGAVKVNKEDEDMVMKDLLRDDFIDDPSYTPDVRQCPIRLPLKNFGGDFYCTPKEEMKPKKEEDKMKNEVVKVKMEMDCDVLPADFTESVEEKVPPRSIDEMVPLTISQLISQTNDTSFIFFQLPHSMPKQKTFLPVSSKATAKPSQSSSTNSSTTEGEEKSVLKTLPEGQIGKLQIMRSGQARLVLGDVKFSVDPGTQPSFKQDVIALVDMTSASKSGNMVHIGNITSRMIVSPDWEALLTDS